MSDEQDTVQYRQIPLTTRRRFYRVGDDGSIWSRGKMPEDPWIRMRLQLSTQGRLQVAIRRKTRQVHRLVLEAFVGPCPPGMEACHDPDRNPHNNRLSNLRWDTRIANRSDARKHGTLPVGEKCRLSKLTEKIVVSIREKYATGLYSQYDLAREFRVRQGNIFYIVSGKTWKHLLPAHPDAPK
jgi:hypothetical protein